MGARRSTTFVLIINVDATSTTTTIVVVATVLFTHLPKGTGFSEVRKKEFSEVWEL